MAQGRRAIRKSLADRKPPSVPKGAPVSKANNASADLKRKNAKLERELSEALDRQTATSDVLKAISRSNFDLQEMLQTLTETAARLCNADMASISRQDEAGFYQATNYNFPSDWVEYTRAFRTFPGRGSVSGRALLEGRAVQVADVEADVEYTYWEMQKKSGYRTFLAVPLFRDGQPIVMLNIARKTVMPFTDKQIELVSTFADQAVIAIENVRLFEEVQARTRDLSESLQQQTATAEVLKVISRSTFDLQTVLNTLTGSAAQLCDADMASISRDDGTGFHHVTNQGFPVDWVDYSRPFRMRAGRGSVVGRALLEGAVVQVADVLGDPEYTYLEPQKKAGYRTFLSVPLLRQGKPIGVLSLANRSVRPFSDKQIGLVQTFADQAVIAIENVRLFDELQARTRDLSEALTYQTGSANILRVIASSPTDVDPVLKSIVESACELCQADDALVTLRDGDELVFQAQHGSIPVVWQRQPIDHEGPSGLAIINGTPVHVDDLLGPDGEQFPRARKFAHETNVRTILSVPLLREGESIGVIVLRRTEVRPFTHKQVSLLQTFADQAVIAIGNVRMFEQVQAKTRDLSESLQQQTATAEVLKVISRSAFDLPTVLTTLTESAKALCGSASGIIYRRDGDVYRYAASTMDVVQAYRDYEQQTDIRAGRGTLIGRMALEKRVVQITDAWNDPEYAEKDAARLGNVRAMLGVPLMRGNDPVGAFALARTEPIPFTPREVELITTFADQAVIAIENARLLEEVQSRTKELSLSLEGLRTAQDRLVQTEKLASLGQLTAGIAHEIKNPLNFINNFSSLSAELVDELNELVAAASLDPKMRTDVGELTQMLTSNLQKVVQHGKRADSIVKNMLLHSREGSGEQRAADINALLDESLNLAYHGARAEKPRFNVTLERDFDESAGSIEVFPQEITRAFLNLISNGFYAATERKSEVDDARFEPTLSATTKNLGQTVEIRIRDNGIGIPPHVKEKMFNPFFTTKPAGEGTGLGLSMSHDIIVKQHGGSIDVESVPGAFTEFTIVLPRTSGLQGKKRGNA
jgi:GAF domain-containing protein